MFAGTRVSDFESGDITASTKSCSPSKNELEDDIDGASCVVLDRVYWF